MKVLVISSEAWREDTNGGNVLSNIFRGIDAEFAQIYCSPGIPQNDICNHYYQMTDSMVLNNILFKKPIGKSFDIDRTIDNISDSNIAVELPNKKLYSFVHRHRLDLFFIVRNILWNLSNWKNENLENFILSFSPNIIFAPCYASTFMHRLTRYVKQRTGKNIISYISDDAYTLKQFNLSPSYWIERFTIRREIRKTFPYYSLVYTMTEAQKQQCEHDFGANMKILLKSIPFGDVNEKSSVNTPIRLLYAGGIYLNRWKTLVAIVNALKVINQDNIRMVLDIYTGNEISKKIYRKLNDNINSYVHKNVSQQELKGIYSKSDLALHVESFDLQNRLAVRMSFSTKIVDCLASGCAVMAICDKKQGGFCYLRNNDAAICISDNSSIYRVLNTIANNSEIILTYAKKAHSCCINHHDPKMNFQMLTNDFKLYESMSN